MRVCSIKRYAAADLLLSELAKLLVTRLQMRREDGMGKNRFPQRSLTLPLITQGYQCTCLCFRDWLWLVCFTAATGHLHVLPAGMMESKGLVCSSLHLAGCWISTSCTCRGVAGQLGFTASVGCSGLLSHCRCDCGTITERCGWVKSNRLCHSFSKCCLPILSLLSWPCSHLATLFPSGLEQVPCPPLAY